MTSSGTFSKLAIILTINLFVHMHTAYAGSIPSVQSIQNEVNNFFSTFSEPASICDKTIDFFATKVTDEIRPIIKKYCDSHYPIVKPSNIFLEWGTKLIGTANEHCLKFTNDGVDDVIGFVTQPWKETCADISKKYLPNDIKGDPLRLYAGIPTSAKNACPDIVNTECGKIGTAQPDMPQLVPFCKENLSKVVCEGDWLSAIQSVAGNLTMNKLEPTTTIKPIECTTSSQPKKSKIDRLSVEVCESYKVAA